MSDHALHVLDCGTMTMQRQVIHFMEGVEPLTIPIRAFVITHPEGNVLVDSGLPLEVVEDPTHWEWLSFATWDADRTQHVVEQIKAAGIALESIRYVVQSHLHFDHIGGIGHFPDAEFVVHQREWDYAHDPQEWVSGPFYPLADIDRPNVSWTFLQTTEEDREHDLYGDGRIRLIFLPRTLGRADVRRGSARRPPGDAHGRRRRHRRPLPPRDPAPYLDLPAIAQSLDNLHRIEQTEGIDLVVFAHDGEQTQDLRSGGVPPRRPSGPFPGR